MDSVDAVSNQVLWVYASNSLTGALIETIRVKFSSDECINWDLDVFPYLTEVQYNNVSRGPYPLRVARFDLSILLTLFMSSGYSSLLTDAENVYKSLRIVRKVRNDYSHTGVDGPELQFDYWIGSVENILVNSAKPEAFVELIRQCELYISSVEGAQKKSSDKVENPLPISQDELKIDILDADNQLQVVNIDFLDMLSRQVSPVRENLHHSSHIVSGWIESYENIPSGTLCQLPVSHTCKSISVAQNVKESGLKLVYGSSVDVDLLDMLDDILVSLYQLLGNVLVQHISVDLPKLTQTWRPLEYWINVVSPLMRIEWSNTLTIHVSDLSQRSIEIYSFFREIAQLIPSFVRIIIEDDLELSYSFVCDLDQSSSLVNMFANQNEAFIVSLGVEDFIVELYKSKFFQLSENIGSVSEFLHQSFRFAHDNGYDINQFLMVDNLRQWLVIVNSLNNLGMVGQLRKLLLAYSTGRMIDVHESSVFFQSGTLGFSKGKIIVPYPILNILTDIATV